jgi:glycosyltransferase involved in cell wall biosynthesis
MKIALVCPASLPATQFGGIVFLAVDLAREISELGHDVTIFTTDLDFTNGPNQFNKKLPRLEKFDKFKIIRTHTWFSLKLFFINPGMYTQLKKEKPDIIHTIGLRSFQSIIAWLVSKKLKIPLIISDQSGLTTHPFLNQSGKILNCLYKIQNSIIQRIIKDSSLISVANEYEKKIFSNINKNLKIKIIRNGVNLKSLVATQNFKINYEIKNKYILFVGRFSESKGIETLIHAFHKSQQNSIMSDTILVIMGVNFGYQEKMLNLIKNLKLSEKIMVIKNPPREDVISAYAQTEFLILPSHWELSPLVPLESFAFKKPVISSNAHGIPYTVIHNVNGILVEPENITELSNAILHLIENKEKCEILGNRGYDLVTKECNSVEMAKATLQCYEDLLHD